MACRSHLQDSKKLILNFLRYTSCPYRRRVTMRSSKQLAGNPSRYIHTNLHGHTTLTMPLSSIV